MMIQHIIQIKIPFINAGRHGRLIGDGQNGNRRPLSVEGFLDAELKGRTVRFRADGKQVASQIDDSALDIPGQQMVFHLICNIAFGDKTEADLTFRVGQRNRISVYEQVVVIDMFERFGDAVRAGDNRGIRFGVSRFVRMKMPQSADRFHRKVDASFAHFAVS